MKHLSIEIARYPRKILQGEVAVGKAAAKASVAVGNHPWVRIPSLSANFLSRNLTTPIWICK
jgi:hypothetical protein